MQPLLLLTSADEARPYDGYLREILDTEGYRAFDEVTTPDALGPEDLAPYPLVMIGAGAATRVCPDAVESYLRAGGRAILLRPTAELARRVGLEPPGPTYGVARDVYLEVNTRHTWLQAFGGGTLQLPGEADVYGPGSTRPLAWLAGQRGRAVPAPAVALSHVGRGLAVVFAYDLADCVVRFHQGRPENASNGPDPDANRDGKFTPDDLLEGVREFGLTTIPQGDVHQDLLVRAILGLTRSRTPVPRLWHFPRCAPAALFVNGDGDGMNAEELRLTVETCERYGAKFTFYLMDDQIAAFSPEEVAALRARGHAFGPHPWVSLKPSVEEWRTEVRRIVASFTRKFGFAPRSVRSHSCIFPGYDETPQLYAETGLRLDTSFINGYRYQSGYANGSGLPVRFASRSGEIIDCYEQTTLHGDDVLCTHKALLPALNEEAALDLSLRTLNRCATDFHGVFHPYFHPIYLSGRGGIPTLRWFEGVLAEAQRRGVPSVSADEWLAFNDARRALEVEVTSWRPDPPQMSLTIRSPQAVSGLTLLLPPFRRRFLEAVTLDGEPLPLIEPSLEAIPWGAVTLELAAGSELRLDAAFGNLGT